MKHEESSAVGVYEIISTIVIWIGSLIAAIVLSKGRYDFNWGLFFAIVGAGFVAGGLHLALYKIISMQIQIFNKMVDIDNGIKEIKNSKGKTPEQVKAQIDVEKNLFDKGIISEEEYNARVERIKKLQQ